MHIWKLKVNVAWLCPTLSDPLDYSPARLLCPWDSPGKNTGVGCHSPLQGIFPTQGSSQHLLHCRQTLYQLSHQGIYIHIYVYIYIYICVCVCVCIFFFRFFSIICCYKILNISVWLTSLSMIISRSIHLFFLQKAVVHSFSLRLSNIPLCVCTTPLSIHLWMDV